MVGQSAVATVQAYAYDATSAELNNIQAQVGSGASITGLFVDPIARPIPTDLPCREQDPDLWFSEHPARLEMAKSFCSVCPARLGCLTGAFARREPWGVWGGEIFEQGEVIAQKRARGRPPKRDIAACLSGSPSAPATTSNSVSPSTAATGYTRMPSTTHGTTV